MEGRERKLEAAKEGMEKVERCEGRKSDWIGDRRHGKGKDGREVRLRGWMEWKVRWNSQKRGRKRGSIVERLTK